MHQSRACVSPSERVARTLHILQAGILLLIPGCGMRAYEEQLEKTRQRMAYLDQEHRLLEDPAHFPDKAPPLFIRLPRGLATHASDKSQPASDWIFHFPWADARFLAPPLDAFVGAAKKSKEESVEQFLQNRVLEYLRLHADEKPAARPGDSPGEIVVTRFSDSLADQQPIRFRRWGYRTNQELPQWPAPARAKLPQRCVFDYDVFVTENAGWWGVVVFKVLNTEATAKSWEKRSVAAELVRKLPTWEPPSAHLTTESGQPLEAREVSLATLRTGERAAERWKLLRR
jgi:hypothetical protein